MAFRDLKLVVAHFGQPYMEQTAILMRKNENVYRTSRPGPTGRGSSTTG